MNIPADGRVPVDPLLEALERERTGGDAEAVARIRGAQDEVISRPAEELLLLQGSAGTGTMVVGVRRVSWLLRADPGRFSDNGILVVGPTPSFVRQLSWIVPSSGHDVAVQVPLSALGPRVRVGRPDPPEISRLKGDLRLLQVIQRALRHRQRITAGPVELTLDGRRVRLDGERIAARGRELADRPHNEAHRELRSFLLSEVGDRLGEGHTNVPARAVAAGSASVHAIDDYLDRAWPDLTPQSFLIGLLANPRQLAAAAGGSLSDHEIRLLTIPPDTRVVSWQWSIDDVALLDAADELLNGPPATYEHIVVHEAQDLSPLQLESIRRRSRTGGVTVLGDLAQGTGAWAHSSWDDVVSLLRRDGVPVMTAELQLGYRLPSEVAEMAAGLLPVVAPGARPPRALRRSGHDVQQVGPTGQGLAEAVAATVRSLVGTGSIAVIVPDAERHAVTDALDDAGVGWSRELTPAGRPVVVSSPAGCRGLEFDCAVVVEPAQIVREGPHGERALYVALTRSTDRLVIVHDRQLPDAIDRPGSHRFRAAEPEPVRSGGSPGPGATPDRQPAAAVGDDMPTAAVPAVAAGQTGRSEDGGPAGETPDGRKTDGGRSDDGAGRGGHGDGMPPGDRYADERYRDGYGSDRYDDRGAADQAVRRDDRGAADQPVRPDDQGAADQAVRRDARDTRAESTHNGMYGWGPEPSGWPPQPAEARGHEAGPAETRWAGPAPGPEHAPEFERAPSVEQPPSTGLPPEVEAPMHARPPGPGAAHEPPPRPGRDPVTWREGPPPAHAMPRERAPWGRAPEPSSRPAPGPADAGPAPVAPGPADAGPAPVAPGPADVAPAPAAPASSAPEPFAELDRAIAHAIAKALTEKLARYATTELLPLVAEEMVRVINRRTGRAAPGAPRGHDAVRRNDPRG
ncbi:MAG TPA: hypothetical protein VFZ68_13265 [Acidimicrobiales bacterium]